MTTCLCFFCLFPLAGKAVDDGRRPAGPRLGPKTQAWLAELGVHSHAQLVELGAVEAFQPGARRAYGGALCYGHCMAACWAAVAANSTPSCANSRQAARAANTAAAAGLGRAERWMALALALAHEAAEAGEVPVGALVVKDGQ